MKKFLTYQVFLVIFIMIVCSILFGALVRYHYQGGQKFIFLQKTAVFFASIPINIKIMWEEKTFNLNKPRKLKKHIKKKRFEQFLPNERKGLLVLPRYDYNLNQSVVDIVDMNGFKIIHTYNHSVAEMYNQVQNTEELEKIKIDRAPIRFQYLNPWILEDGSLISLSPLFRMDFCSNLQWLNDELNFHHSITLDHENNIWVGGQIKPYSKFVKKYEIQNFKDDVIVKINTDGKILYKKSVIEILIENNILPENNAITSILSNQDDPIHLNDIQPAFTDTEYWKKGDVFISIRHLSSIIHYRPSNNEVINYLTGPFAEQHDVDIISSKEISIFNNNNFVANNEHSEVLIYNFETKSFRKLFNKQLKKENFKTLTEGLSQILKDGSLMVEETDHGRIILFNKNGQKEWEYVNKHDNGDIGFISWSSIIENENLIDKFKSLVESKKCIN